MITAPAPAIDAQGLRKEFGTKVAVADLTLQVEPGEIFGFLGPNGAGKTTAVKMLLGLTAPTAGTASLLGRPLGDRPTRAQIGFLPEHFRFHEWLRAGEFLALHGRLYGMSRQERDDAIPRVLNLVGLSEQVNTKLKAFSKGMLQRIGLAQSLLNDPKLVFLDEPTSGLDPIGRRLVRDTISDLRAAGKTVFLNSHLLSEVEKTCDRVAFIHQGRLLQTMTLDESYSSDIRVTLRVGQPTPDLLGALGQFCTEVSMEKDRRAIQLRLAQESQIPELARWLVEQGHLIYELTPQQLSLEDQFMRIVGHS
jgi:ABC-2 type transport system ATP-binding protein